MLLKDCTYRRWLFVILSFSLLLRLGVALYLGDVVDAPPLMSDQRSYHALGVSLISGRGFSFEQGWYPFTLPHTPTAHWSFLYPLFVAAVYGLFGIHPLAVRLTQAVLGGILLPWMVYRLAQRLFPKWDRVALLAAGLTACYGYFILFAATLMTETFYIVLVLWSLEVSLRLARAWHDGEPVPWLWALELGLSLGLAALMRQSILPWVPILFLTLLMSHRSNTRILWRTRIGALALASVVMLACILPWTVRNYRVYGEFLLLNSNTGYAMYSAQHPMHGMTFHEYAAAPLPSDLRGLNEAQMDRILLRRGLQFVLDDPGRYLRLCLSRLRAYLEFWPSRDTIPLHNIGRVVSFGLYLPFILYGYYLAFRRHLLGQGNWLIPLFVVTYSLMHILTWAMVRYRLPTDAASMPFAALGLANLLDRLRT